MTQQLRRYAGPGVRSAAEDLSDLGGRGHVELVVAALFRALVRAPALEVGRVAETRALEMVVRDFDDALEAQRDPAQIFASVPAARRARHALVFVLPLRPLAPR